MGQNGLLRAALYTVQTRHLLGRKDKFLVTSNLKNKTAIAAGPVICTAFSITRNRRMAGASSTLLKTTEDTDANDKT